MLRVLVMTARFPPLEYRAISQVAYDQACALVRKGIQVTVITQNCAPQDAFEDHNGVRIHRIGAPRYQVSSWEMEPLVWTPAYLDYIYRNFSWDEFDVIHTHGIDFALLSEHLVHVCQTPVVAQFHVCYRKRAEIGEVHFNLELAHYYQFYAAQRASVVVAVSNAEKLALSEYLYCGAKTVVLPNGLNLESYRIEADKRERVRAQHKLEDQFVVLWGGRVGDFMKGPDIVARAFSKLAARQGCARLVVSVVQAGPPESLWYLMNNLSEEARSRTLVVYPKDKEELLGLYAAADVFVMPSRYEPFGLMALEAMACGLPVLVSPRDGLDELVEAGRTGLKIQWGGVEESADNLAYQVNTIIENRDLGKFLGKNARASAVRFDINRITERLVEIYRNVC